MGSDGAARLAVAVLEQALTDRASADRRIRDSAVRFLTDPDRAADRAFWCHLAHVNDAALVATVRAEMRMADEIDKGQARGEVATREEHPRGLVRNPDMPPATLDNLGVSRQRLAEWRDVRDAGPAVVEAATSDAPCV